MFVPHDLCNSISHRPSSKVSHYVSKSRINSSSPNNASKCPSFTLSTKLNPHRSLKIDLLNLSPTNFSSILLSKDHQLNACQIKSQIGELKNRSILQSILAEPPLKTMFQFHHGYLQSPKNKSKKNKSIKEYESNSFVKDHYITELSTRNRPSLKAIYSSKNYNPERGTTDEEGDILFENGEIALRHVALSKILEKHCMRAMTSHAKKNIRNIQINSAENGNYSFSKHYNSSRQHNLSESNNNTKKFTTRTAVHSPTPTESKRNQLKQIGKYEEKNINDIYPNVSISPQRLKKSSKIKQKDFTLIGNSFERKGFKVDAMTATTHHERGNKFSSVHEKSKRSTGKSLAFDDKQDNSSKNESSILASLSITPIKGKSKYRTSQLLRMNCKSIERKSYMDYEFNINQYRGRFPKIQDRSHFPVQSIMEQKAVTENSVELVRADPPPTATEVETPKIRKQNSIYEISPSVTPLLPNSSSHNNDQSQEQISLQTIYTHESHKSAYSISHSHSFSQLSIPEQESIPAIKPILPSCSIVKKSLQPNDSTPNQYECTGEDNIESNVKKNEFRMRQKFKSKRRSIPSNNRHHQFQDISNQEQVHYKYLSSKISPILNKQINNKHKFKKLDKMQPTTLRIYSQELHNKIFSPKSSTSKGFTSILMKNENSSSKDQQPSPLPLTINSIPDQQRRKPVYSTTRTSKSIQRNFPKIYASNISSIHQKYVIQQFLKGQSHTRKKEFALENENIMKAEERCHPLVSKEFSEYETNIHQKSEKLKINDSIKDDHSNIYGNGNGKLNERKQSLHDSDTDNLKIPMESDIYLNYL